MRGARDEPRKDGATALFKVTSSSFIMLMMLSTQAAHKGHEEIVQALLAIDSEMGLLEVIYRKKQRVNERIDLER